MYLQLGHRAKGLSVVSGVHVPAQVLVEVLQTIIEKDIPLEHKRKKHLATQSFTDLMWAQHTRYQNFWFWRKYETRLSSDFKLLSVFLRTLKMWLFTASLRYLEWFAEGKRHCAYAVFMRQAHVLTFSVALIARSVGVVDLKSEKAQQAQTWPDPYHKPFISPPGHSLLLLLPSRAIRQAFS